MKKILLFIIIGFCLLVSINMKFPKDEPDIQEFSSKIVDCIINKDADGIDFLLYNCSFEDYKGFIELMKKDTTCFKTMRMLTKSKFNTDSTLLKQYDRYILYNKEYTRERLRRLDSKDSIDVTKLVFIHTYYKSMHELPPPFASYDLDIVCSYDSIYVKFTFSNILYTPKGFVGGRLDDVGKYDKKGNEIIDLMPILDSIKPEEEKITLQKRILQKRTDRAYNKYIRLANK